MTNVTCFDTEPDSASLGSQPCNKAGAPSRIFIPNASTQGPTTSGAVQINRGNFMGAGGCAEGGRVHIQQDFTGAFTGGNYQMGRWPPVVEARRPSAVFQSLPYS